MHSILLTFSCTVVLGLLMFSSLTAVQIMKIILLYPFFCFVGAVEYQYNYSYSTVTIMRDFMTTSGLNYLTSPLVSINPDWKLTTFLNYNLITVTNAERSSIHTSFPG